MYQATQSWQPLTWTEALETGKGWQGSTASQDLYYFKGHLYAHLADLSLEVTQSELPEVWCVICPARSWNLIKLGVCGGFGFGPKEFNH